jgi:hypothetical protein
VRGSLGSQQIRSRIQAGRKNYLRITISPQRLKPSLKQATYRSGEPLRHPKSKAESSFSRSLLGGRILFGRSGLGFNFCPLIFGPLTKEKPPQGAQVVKQAAAALQMPLQFV